MQVIRLLPEQEERIETGPLQFGKDWPGIFIRGDHALYYAMKLEELLNGDETLDPIDTITIQGLLDLLRSCHV